MNTRKKIAIWVTVVVGALLALLIIFILLLPNVINLEPVRGKILAVLSQRVGGELEFQRLDLSFFPRPRVIFHRGSLSIPGKVASTLESLKIYPRILPLLRGRVQIAMARVDTLHAKMEIPKPPEEKEEKPKVFSLTTIEEGVAPVLALMALKAPDLVVVVDHSWLILTEENTPVFWFRDIQARVGLPPDKLEIDLTCESNLWERISVEGWLDAENFNGSGRIHVRNLQPQKLASYLPPFAGWRVEDSEVNLDLNVTTDGLNAFQGSVRGSFPSLTLRYNKQRLAIKAKILKGSFRLDEDRITVSLDELDLDHPQLRMSGTLLIDQPAPRISFELEGREIDVNSMTEAVLAIAGDIPNAREFLGMVKGGKIPSITVRAEGSSLTDLEKVENFFIKGSIVDGEFLLPGANIGLEGVDLDVGEINGEVVISQGILEGKDLEARWKNAQVREGILRLDLKEEGTAFQVETLIEVDLAQLPPLIRGLVRDEVFIKELALLKYIQGRVLGKLVVGESKGSINVRADISEFNLVARYDRIPYALKIKRGQIFYDGNTFVIKNLSADLGKSSFSEINAQFSFEKDPYLETLSGKSLVVLDEIYPWLSSLKGLNGALKNLKSVQGTIELSTLTLKGPLFKPEKWRFRMTGELRDLAIESSLFPGQLATQGTFEVVPKKISLTDARINILDASLRLSCFFNDYLEVLQKADFTFQGSIGQETMQWVSNLIEVPPKLRVRAPLSISQAHVGWNKSGTNSFSADLAIKDGPKVSIDMHLNPEELRINNALIEDRESRASFALKLKESELHLDFKGHLDKATLDKVFIENEILTGRIDGDFEAHILMDRPMKSTANGILQGVGLGYPLGLKVPLTIENVSLKARKNNLNVESALLTLGDSHLTLKGNMDFSDDTFFFDMNLSADGIEWEKIEEILHEENKESGSEQHTDFWAIPLRGTLGVKFGYFKYGRFTWKPMHVAISFMAGGINVAVTEANLCGISTPGVVKVIPQDVSLDFKPVCRGQRLRPVLACLFDVDLDATGNLDFKGEITSRAKPEELVQSIRGDFAFIARDGRIYRSIPLSRVLGLLNTTEILRGKLPDLKKEGLAYNFIEVKGNLRNGKLMIKEAIMDGRSIEIAAQGEMDLIDQKIDFTVLVAPLKTVDFVAKKVPVVKGLLGGTLVSIPVRIRGDLANPKVSVLSASAMGSELIGIMKRTFHLPLKVIQPLRVDTEEKEDSLYRNEKKEK